MDVIHVTMASGDRLPLFATRAQVLAAVACLCEVLGAALLLFCVVDDHVHLVLERVPTRVLARLQRRLSAIASRPVGEPFVRRVRDRKHLTNLVAYVLKQSAHHGVQGAPPCALEPGSCFADLVGARVLVEPLAPRLQRWMPRWSPSVCWSHVGLRALEPASDELVFELGAGAVLREVAAAGGVADPRQMRGDLRRTAAALLHGVCRMTAPVVADVLGMASRTVRKDLVRGGCPELERAARLRLAIRWELVRRVLGE